MGANEEVLCWDVKKGELLSRWQDKDCRAEVTCIAQSDTDPDVFAVGHSDGSIRLWDSRISTIIISFNGHKSAITRLAFDQSGVRLASGARDTDIIVWDLVAEVGRFKLRGHKGEITGLSFLQAADPDGSTDESGVYLLSTSKDALIKIWDVESQYCIETHVTQSNGECWALAISPDGSGCITAGNEGELKVWSLDRIGLLDASTSLENRHQQQYLHDRGILRRQGGDRTVGIVFHPKADYFAVHGSEKAVELWRIRTQAEVQKSLARKRRRRREKARAEGEPEEDEDAVEADTNPSTADVTEVFVPHVIVRTAGKVRSIGWAGYRPGHALQLVVAATNNLLEVYSASQKERAKKPKSDDAPEYSRTHAIELPGHRADIRAVSLSSDDRMLATASSGSLKIWNVQTQSCLRTLECGYALCCSFLPGDKIVLVGNKNGELELFDIASSALIETIKAHDAAIWTLKVHPDGKSVATGSADKSVKFWDFQIVQEDIPGTRRSAARLALVHKRTLKLNDDILSLCFSPDNGRLLAVSTLDNTVKVFFTDSLKLFLNLYGHKLPVLHISISSDSKLIATCSADKNVRLWGLDFGDCHRAFFAHDESIMQVSFIPHPISREDAHIFFSAAKDGLVKTWDGNKFEHIQTLRGHHAEIWALALSRNGDFAVSASHDRSIRIWRQSDEPLFLEEEREKDLEDAYDANITTALEHDAADEEALRAANGDTADVVAPTKQTAGTLTAGEKITEALAMCVEDVETLREQGAHAQRHPLLQFKGVSAERHLLSVFEAIPAPSLQDALLLLSFSLLPDLFRFILLWLKQEMNVPLSCRVLFFLLQTHHKQVVASRELRASLGELQTVLRDVLGRWKGVMGFNLAGVNILGRRVRESSQKSFQEDQEPVHGTGKKRRFVNVA